MPWKAVGNKIVRADTGKVVGHSKDHATAVKAVRARYANSSDYQGVKGYLHHNPNRHSNSPKKLY